MSMRRVVANVTTIMSTFLFRLSFWSPWFSSQSGHRLLTRMDLRIQMSQ